MTTERQERVFNYLRERNIPFTCYSHPEGKTIEEAKRWWKDDGSVHCKNDFIVATLERNVKIWKQAALAFFNCLNDIVTKVVWMNVKRSYNKVAWYCCNFSKQTCKRRFILFKRIQ